MHEKPLFIPLKAKFFDQFKNGTKHNMTEYRQRNARWNAENCRIGRRVVLSRGYGKRHRLHGQIIGFHYDNLPASNIPGWLECYGTGGTAACLKIKLDEPT